MAFSISGLGDEEHSELADINVTPLVDVMLVLLIIFMITAPMLHQGIEVALPKADAEPITLRVDDPLVLSIDRDGLVYVQDEPIHPSQLLERLAPLLEARDEDTVFLKGDRELPYGTIMEVLAILNRAASPGRHGHRAARLVDSAQNVHENLDTLLSSRIRSGSEAYRKPSVLLSLGLHVVLFATVLLAPLVTAGDPEPLEFVAVQIVPVQALGVTSPAPAPVQKAKPKTAPPCRRPSRNQSPRNASRASRAAEPSKKARSTPKPTESPQSNPVQAGLELRWRPRSAAGLPSWQLAGHLTVGCHGWRTRQPGLRLQLLRRSMLAMISANWLGPIDRWADRGDSSFSDRSGRQYLGCARLAVLGIQLLDLAGLRAVQQAAPFPRLPQSYQHKSLGVDRFPMNWQGSRSA